MTCPLCQSPKTDRLLQIENKLYWHCMRCDLRFLDADFYLTRADEEARYRHHENDVHDVGYQKYAEPLINSLKCRLNSFSLGLDYGCGAGSVAGHLLNCLTSPIALYDPVFHPHSAVLDQRYDFVIASEVVEHFHEPGREMAHLRQLLRPKGFLAVMTKLYGQEIDFANWYYRKDPTHVCFYSRETMQWIATFYNYCAVEFDADRVTILTCHP